MGGRKRFGQPLRLPNATLWSVLSMGPHPAASGPRRTKETGSAFCGPRGGRWGRAPIRVEAAANAHWSLDFVHVARLRPTVPHPEHHRRRDAGMLAAIPDTSISGRRVARELTVLTERRGKPGMIVSDNGTEFTSNAVLVWTQYNRIVWHFIAPGKPMQNGFCERFNGCTRDELLRS